MTARQASTTLALAAVVLTMFAIVVRSTIGGDVRSPDAMLPILVALAALCVLGLARVAHPTVGALALILVLSITTVELAGIARVNRGSLEANVWDWLAIGICLAAIASVSAAVIYAADPARRITRWTPVLGAIAVLSIFVAALWVIATPDQPSIAVDPGTPLGDLALVTRSFLILTAAFVLLGLAGDLRPAHDAARRRLEMSGDRRSSPPRYAVAWLRTMLGELSPGRMGARRAAEEERARIARDLHAIVVPDLRRAIRETEEGGSVDRLATSLRGALRDVEDMIEERDMIGLQIGGLPGALESLAERVEDQSAVRVTIDILDDRPASSGSPPPDVAASAARVARLALDNIVRHAPTADVTLSLTSGAKLVRLCIADDGGGASSDRDQSGRGAAGRGLADMNTEAAMTDASVRIERDPNRGTTVVFEWPSPLIH